MGRSLYPRVPDLLSSETLRLTDGELHYIIANGVRLTGMPAWGSPHQETEDDSWGLVLFIRSYDRHRRREIGGIQVFRIVALCWLPVLSKMPRRNLRALAKNTDGKCRA